MKNKNFPRCNVCEQVIISDASAKTYCKLCGMIKKTMPLFLGCSEMQHQSISDITENKKRFCCENREDKFKTYS